MRFVSKNSNLLIVLSPGIPAQPLSGTPAKPGLYVKFKGGVVDIKDEDVINKMKSHSGFNTDFIAVEDGERDPYSDYREETEPGHVVSELKYGHVEKPIGSPKKAKLTPEMTKLIKDMAVEMAKEMLPGMVKETVKKLADEQTKANSKKTGDAETKD